MIFYLGLAAMTGAWLELGRRVLRITRADCAPDADRPPDAASHATVALIEGSPATLRRYVLGCCVPFLFAAPFGRDLWAYAAQGNLVRHGIDPYAHGPAALPGAFTDEVSRRWLHTSAPYGPLWLQISHGIDTVAGQHVLAAAVLLRLPAFAGLLLWLWALPHLARRFDGGTGRRAAAALWLGAASPLTIVLGLGGGHNDLLMIGLIVAGLALATGRSFGSLALAGAVIAVGVMVKSPAAIAVAFAVPIWLTANRRAPTLRHVLVACSAALGGAAAIALVVTVASGLGTGWTHQVNTAAPWVSWLSLPSAAVMLGKLLTGNLRELKAVDGALQLARTIGEALAVAVSAALWFLALRRASLACLAVALGAVALLAPSVQPWYYCWALALAGLVVRSGRLLIALAAVSIAFPVMITPSGVGLESSLAAIPIIAGAAALAWFSMRAPVSTPDDNGPDHTRTQVRADDRPQLGNVQFADPR